MNLDILRKKINTIDADIVTLLGKRQALMPFVGKYKKEHKLPFHQAKREKEIISKLENMATQKKVDPVLVKKIFKLIFRNSKDIQKKS